MSLLDSIFSISKQGVSSVAETIKNSIDDRNAEIENSQSEFIKSLVPDEEPLGFCFVDKSNPSKGYFVVTPTKIFLQGKNESLKRVLLFSEIERLCTEGVNAEDLSANAEMSKTKLSMNLENNYAKIEQEKYSSKPNINNAKQATSDAVSGLLEYAFAFAENAYQSYKGMYRSVVVCQTSGESIEASGFKRDDIKALFGKINKRGLCDAVFC